MLLNLPCISLQLENEKTNRPTPPESGRGLAQNWKPVVFFSSFFAFFSVVVFFFLTVVPRVSSRILPGEQGGRSCQGTSLGTEPRWSNPQRSDSAARIQVDFACFSLSFLFLNVFFSLYPLTALTFFVCLFLSNVTYAFSFLLQKKERKS